MVRVRLRYLKTNDKPYTNPTRMDSGNVPTKKVYGSGRKLRVKTSLRKKPEGGTSSMLMTKVDEEKT